MIQLIVVMIIMTGKGMPWSFAGVHVETERIANLQRSQNRRDLVCFVDGELRIHHLWYTI